MKATREAIEEARKRGLVTRMSLHLTDRSLEWFSSCVMVIWGATLMLPGDTLAGPQFEAFGRFGLTEDFWSWMFTGIGMARLVALYINGRWPRSPHIRMIGSAFGVLTWAQVSYLLTAGTFLKTGVANTGMGVYAALAMADLFGVYRAMFDARYYRT